MADRGEALVWLGLSRVICNDLAMRWDALFDDLEAQAEALQAQERAGEIEERVRLETARLRLADRLRPAVGSVLRLRIAGGLVMSGVLQRFAAQWLLIEDDQRRETLLPTTSVLTISGLGRFSEARPASVTESRLGLAYALRGVSRDRSGVRLLLVDGAPIDGTIDRVGADFLEIAVHAGGELRRRHEVRDVLAVPFAALAAVRRDSGEGFGVTG